MQDSQKSLIYHIVTDEQFSHFLEFMNRVEQKLGVIDKVSEEVLTVPQTMSLFKCSRATLNNWRNKKKLMPKVLEGRVYYLKSDCLKVLNNPEFSMGTNNKV